MKKLTTLFLALAIGFGLKAQCPLTQAVDFTATDCHGTEVHLFDILDSGQHVLIDFFYTTCGPCQQATPKVVESYYAMGCNMHDVYYMEITCRNTDTDEVCQNWCQTYGVEYPTISGPAGGVNICNQYGISYYPTVILIAPNRDILINDLWPISTAQDVINALEAQGLEQHDCNTPAYDPQVSIYIDQVLETEVTATFTPNEDCASYSYMLATESEIQQWMSMTGLDLPDYLHTYGFPAEETLSHTFSALEPNTEYMIYAVPVDLDGNFGPVAQEAVVTTPGGSSEIIPDFTGTDIDGNEINLYSILDAGQAVFINFFLYGDPYSEQPMADVLEAYRLYGCNQHDVFFMEITPNGHDDDCRIWVDQFGVEYPTISRDGGGNTIAQAIPVGLYPTLMLIRPDHTIAVRDIYPPTLEYIIDAFESESYMQYECEDGIEEAENQLFTLFPNPANESLTLKGENLGTVRVYNVLGQKVDEFEANDTETNINTTRYEDGVYVVKAGEKMMKFVVKHWLNAKRRFPNTMKKKGCPLQDSPSFYPKNRKRLFLLQLAQTSSHLIGGL